ncbi:hypothetical protein MKW98_032310 [Papaver atlanticum]|uniref:Uncharacterized protein n=1 Tax=Papaver atlanticum TaxID=357466 RepID=A0AAD4SHI4_9MAGN|nr:hypothetical protein MKW98_032310 [Papaver atlanticum]
MSSRTYKLTSRNPSNKSKRNRFLLVHDVFRDKAAFILDFTSSSKTVFSTTYRPFSYISQVEEGKSWITYILK